MLTPECALGCRRENGNSLKNMPKVPVCGISFSRNQISFRERSMKVNTYLNYGGNCAEAFKFYEQHLGAKIGMMMMFSDMPDPSKAPPGMQDAVLHANIT